MPQFFRHDESNFGIGPNIKAIPCPCLKDNRDIEYFLNSASTAARSAGVADSGPHGPVVATCQTGFPLLSIEIDVPETDTGWPGYFVRSTILTKSAVFGPLANAFRVVVHHAGGASAPVLTATSAVPGTAMAPLAARSGDGAIRYQKTKASRLRIACAE